MASAQDPWSNIPLDVAELVLKRLPAHVDRVRFAAVCPQWRSAMWQIKLPPPMPLLALKDADIFYSMPRGEPLHFAGYKNGHLSAGCRKAFYTACGNWLVYKRLSDMLLLDPFSGATMTLPAQSSIVSTNISKNLLMDVKYSNMIKLVVCSPNLIAALFQGPHFNRIAVCRPGGFMWSVARDVSLWINNMTFYQGKLYVVGYHEDLSALDISLDDNTGDPWVSLIGRVINVNQFDNEGTLLRMLYLVESNGSLLLVRRRMFHTNVHGEGQIHTFAGQCEPDVSIFKADFARSQWVKMTTCQALPTVLGNLRKIATDRSKDRQQSIGWGLDDIPCR